MSARSHRVPAIENAAHEELLYGLLKELAAHLSQVLADDGIGHGFIGGTALKVGYGLTRPTTDLDVKIESARDFTTHIDRAFEQIAGWSHREPTEDEWNRGAEGIIVRHLESGRTLGTRIDFVPGPIHDTVTWLCVAAIVSQHEICPFGQNSCGSARRQNSCRSPSSFGS